MSSDAALVLHHASRKGRAKGYKNRPASQVFQNKFRSWIATENDLRQQLTDMFNRWPDWVKEMNDGRRR
jgi:hypothetical protein